MKRKSKILGLAISAILLLVLIPIPSRAQLIPHEYTLDIPCYAPTRITFNYAYTHNHSILDISTVGVGAYIHSGGPNFLEFIAKDIDTYHFTIELHYNELTNQTIVIGIWSGNHPMQGLSFHSIFEDIIIHVTLMVTKEPTYPSELEVAKAVVASLSRDLQEQNMAIQATIARQNTQIMMLSAFSIISFMGVTVLSFAYYIDSKRRRGMAAPKEEGKTK